MTSTSLGDPLECFRTTTNGHVVLSVVDEDGQTYQYSGAPNPFSKTTIFGRWTGVNPFADDLPVEVKGRAGPQTSALDSFSMLYYIQSQKGGFHNPDVERMYVARIQAALDANIIASARDFGEFDAAQRLIRSYITMGHLYDILNPVKAYDPSVNLAARYNDKGWMQFNPQTSFPMFTLSEAEKDQYRLFLEVNGGNQLKRIDTLNDMLFYMNESGLNNTFEYNWFRGKMADQAHLSHAFEHLKAQFNEIAAHTQGKAFAIEYYQGGRTVRPTASKIGSIQEELSYAITKQIIETLI